MKKICLLFSICLFWSCSMTKRVPDGKYLLDKYEISSDSKNVDISYLTDFLRQTPNSSLPFLGRVRLAVFNMAGTDSTKWLNRNIQKLGQKPVIYSSVQTLMSAEQMQKELVNRGFLNAKIDTTLKGGNKKVSVKYHVNLGVPYRIRRYELNIDDSTIDTLLRKRLKFSNIKEGHIFDKSILDTERGRMNTFLRNVGYYDFTRDNLFYKADTTLNSHQVDLYLSLYQRSDSLSHNRYKLRNITIRSGYDVTDDANSKYFENPDTTYYSGLTIIHGKNNFLRPSTLSRSNFLKSGKYFSDFSVSRTFSTFSRISAIKQTTLSFAPVKAEEGDSTKYLDAFISLSPANTHWFETSIDGTNSAGALGVAPSISYRHRNFFNGGETFSLQLKGAYEFIPGASSTDLTNQNFFEYGINTSISFPEFLFRWLKDSWRDQSSASTQVALGVNIQKRPEYTRQFFNAGLSYSWASSTNRVNHTLNLIDVNYIGMPWVSDLFSDIFFNDPFLKATYQDQLISRIAYNITYASPSARRNPRNNYTIRAGVDYGGGLPRLASVLGGSRTAKDGSQQILGISYAEYIKGDVSYAYTLRMDRKNSLAYHFALGVAQPFGNSKIMPFEKRYFSGGANSVRGWNTRTLGPGSFRFKEGDGFFNQVGDIRFDMNLEYRSKAGEYLELATFIDAGNVWTIRNYENQSGGLFEFSDFYKEIAMSYGVGLRFDLSFLIIRLDGGMKAYDPSRDLGDRFVFYRPKFRRDFAWHFAIGYPF